MKLYIVTLLSETNDCNSASSKPFLTKEGATEFIEQAMEEVIEEYGEDYTKKKIEENSAVLQYEDYDTYFTWDIVEHEI